MVRARERDKGVERDGWRVGRERKGREGGKEGGKEGMRALVKQR